MYYLKTQTVVDPINFGLDVEVIKKIEKRRNKKNQPINKPIIISNEPSNENKKSTTTKACEIGCDTCGS